MSLTLSLTPDPCLPSNAHRVTPFSGTHKVGGYSILQGESLEEISKLLDGHPHFHSPNASVEVREFLSMPGMS